jgi:ribonuclease Z
MKAVSVAVVTLLVVAGSNAQTPTSRLDAENGLKVILLGTSGGPTFDAQRLGIGTLVIAGPELLLFDAGRAVSTGMVRAGIAPADVTKVFLTHLHSDHVASVPELYLFPWAQGRATPFQVWGPAGTRAMMEHLQEAFAFDTHVRRDVDEKLPADGIRAVATDIKEGTVYEANGVKVTAFLVDHAPVAPAFGYRVDYRGHSVALSGDTRPSDNLVKAAEGVDVLIHELGTWKHDPAFSGPPNERMPGRRQTRAQALTIAEHHTDAEEAGRVFKRVRPKLAVFSHYNTPNVDLPTALRLVRQTYAGQVEFGEDGMTIEIGDMVTIRRPSSPTKQ